MCQECFIPQILQLLPKLYKEDVEHTTDNGIRIKIYLVNVVLGHIPNNGLEPVEFAMQLINHHMDERGISIHVMDDINVFHFTLSRFLLLNDGTMVHR